MVTQGRPGRLPTVLQVAALARSGTNARIVNDIKFNFVKIFLTSETSPDKCGKCSDNRIGKDSNDKSDDCGGEDHLAALDSLWVAGRGDIDYSTADDHDSKDETYQG